VECLDIAKDKVSTPLDIQHNLENLFGRLDELNQLVVQELADLCQEIASPTNSAINRMTLQSLAIVFSPSFLRNLSEDPIELLQNTKFETRFVTLLFETLGKRTPGGGTAIVGSSGPPPRRTVAGPAAETFLISTTTDLGSTGKCIPDEPDSP